MRQKALTMLGLGLFLSLTAGFAPPPTALTWRGQERRKNGPVMMPSDVPQVPWKAPGMVNPQWIDVYNRMYRERILFLGQDIEDDFANTIIAVLLYLETEARTLVGFVTVGPSFLAVSRA